MPSAATGDQPYAPNTVVTIRKVDGAYLSNTVMLASNEFDPVSLDTVSAPFIFDDNLGSLGTSVLTPEHARMDPHTGDLVQFYSNMQTMQYQVFTTKNGTRTRVVAPNTVPCNPKAHQLLYQHSYALTEDYLIMSEVPVNFGGNWNTWKWHPEWGTSFRVIDRVSGAEVYNFPAAENMFMMHHINSFYEASTNSLVSSGRMAFCNTYTSVDVVVSIEMRCDAAANTSQGSHVLS